MEDHLKNQNSGENKPENPDFEFGSLTPSSPSQDPFSSPADHLFFNGRLLPHAFPASHHAILRSISRTTSEDSSRSNSTNSRRSSSSSSPSSYTPRTSSCSTNSSTGGGDHRPSSEYSRLYSRGKTVNTKSKEGAWKCKSRKATQLVTAQLYGSYSQRWQYLTPVPGTAFKRERSSAKRGGGGAGGGCGGGVRVGGGGGCGRRTAERLRKKAEEKRGSSRVVRWWKRMVRAVALACRECHAMAPEGLPNENDDDDVDMQRGCNCP